MSYMAKITEGCWNGYIKTIFNLKNTLRISQCLDLDCPLFYSVLEKTQNKLIHLFFSLEQWALNMTTLQSWKSDNRTKTLFIC